MEKTIVWLPNGDLVPALKLNPKYLLTIAQNKLFYNTEFQ